MQDVLPPQSEDSGEKRSIREIPIRKDREFKNGSSAEAAAKGSSGKAWEFRKPGRGGRLKRWPVIGAVALALAILAVGLSVFFSGATVLATPKEETATINGTFMAIKDSKPGEFQYETMTLSKEASLSVPATGEKHVERKASGNIIIYNNYGSESQRLLKNTRFETPQGLVYRVDKSVVVPGRKSEGGAMVPGSIEVTVYADLPGPSYNIGLTDFTIPGLKGDPRYEKFYARSKTPMAGGVSGVVKTVDETVLKTSVENLQNKLKDELFSEAGAQKPEDFVLYDDGIFIEFESLPNREGEGEVTITEKAALYGMIFKKTALSEQMARGVLSDYDGKSILVKNIEDLKFAIIGRDGARPWEEGAAPIQFSMEGNANFVWLFDKEQLKIDLAGKPKDGLASVLAGYPGVSDAKAVLRPFWKRSFPSDPADIEIEESSN